MVKSQKLKLKDIKVGQKVIIKSIIGKFDCVVVVSRVFQYSIDVSINDGGHFNFNEDSFNFYICPPSLELVPNWQYSDRPCILLEGIRPSGVAALAWEGPDMGICTAMTIPTRIPDINDKKDNLLAKADELIEKANELKAEAKAL